MNKFYLDPCDTAKDAKKHQKKFPCRCFDETEIEKNIAKTEAKQVFDFGPISGSVISGPVTNNQVQVVVNLAFDEIEIEI